MRPFAVLAAAVLTLAAGGAGDGRAAACAASDRSAACLSQRLIEAEADLASVRRELPAKIDAWDGNVGPESRASWKADLAASLDAWLAFRDARCDAALLAFEARPADTSSDPIACRLRITAVIVSDLKSRYDIGPQARPRADAETPRKRPSSVPAGDDEAAVLGICAKAPSGGCDTCGVNACMERRVKAANRELDAGLRGALARIRSQKRFAAAERADGSERLRRAQRAWTDWRDRTCEVERYETPNPYARSIYAMATAPCLIGETTARAAVLRQAYRPRR